MAQNKKEYMREYMRMYRKNNLEKVKKLQKNWIDKNKEHIKEYRETNKEQIREKQLSWRENHHNGIWKVYILPNADYYVGYTKAIKPRMYRHKQLGRDYSDYMILHECSTKEEAIEYEKIYHQLGFPGKKKK